MHGLQRLLKRLAPLGIALALGTSTASAHEVLVLNGAGTATPNGGVRFAGVSADGRILVFFSDASDLGPTDTNATSDVYARDLQTGTNVLVSSNAAGSDSGDSPSSLAVVDASGRWVMFVSNGSDFGPTDTNGQTDVYLRDLQTGTTTLVSQNAAGTDSGDGGSEGPRFVVNARYVGFTSGAGNLGPVDSNAVNDVYLRDLQSGTTTLISVNADGNNGGNDHSYFLAASPDGRYIAFSSAATDLTPDIADGFFWLFVRDLQNGTTERIARSTGAGDRIWFSPDSSFVVFESDSGDLVPADTNETEDVFMRDLQTGEVTLLSVNAAGTDSGNARSREPSLSPDGRLVAFWSAARDLEPVDPGNGAHLYVRDLQTGGLRRYAKNAQGTASCTGGPSRPGYLFSPNSRFLAIRSECTDLGPIDTNDTDDVYVHDLLTDTLTLVSVNAAGTDSGNGQSLLLAFFPDSRRIIIESAATDFGANDLNGTADLFAAAGYDRSDLDGDGIPNAQDPCPDDLDNDPDGDGFCSNEVLYFSPADTVTLGTLTVNDEDIVRFDEATNAYSMFFDGSDLGLGGQDVDAFSVRADGSILMSFTADFTLTGVGTVRKQDVVRFVPTSVGATTAGTFAPYFVGSDHGLTASTADVDGVQEADDGRFLISLRNGLTVAGLAIANEDIVRFNPDTNDYSMILDGSDVGLAAQAIDAFSFQPDGSLLLSLADYPEQSGLPGLPAGPIHNVFQFVPQTFPDAYGSQTSGTFHPFFIGGLNQAPASLNIDGLWRNRSTIPRVYQAESAVFGGGSLYETTTTNAGSIGGGYINSAKNGGFIEFQNVHGGSGGTKVLRLRNALGASSSRTGRLIVNGVAQAITFPPTGAWTNWTRFEVSVTLTSGPQNTIRLETNGDDLANIDQIEIVSSYEAEAAAIDGGSLYETVNTGFLGAGYVNSATTGGVLEFTQVDGGVGGQRTLRIRNALGVSGSRTGTLFINGAAQPVTFPSTGQWTTWQERDVIVTLNPGPLNTIRFETTGQDLANIDRIEIH